MVVRIRLQRGPTPQLKKQKNRHLALASAALLTPAAVAALVLSLWRLGADLGFAGSFAIHAGILSHWQVWLAISVIIQFIAVLLNRYGTPEPDIPALVAGSQGDPKLQRLADSHLDDPHCRPALPQSHRFS